jgi:hypothetical protein
LRYAATWSTETVTCAKDGALALPETWQTVTDAFGNSPREASGRARKNSPKLRSRRATPVGARRTAELDMRIHLDPA